MRYVAAYCLSAMGGNDKPSVADLNKIIASVGIDCDEGTAKKVVEALKGKDLAELIAEGSKKLAAMPTGGGAAAPAAGGAAAPAGAPAEKEEKKEEKKAESESEDDDMGFGLFD